MRSMLCQRCHRAQFYEACTAIAVRRAARGMTSTCARTETLARDTSQLSLLCPSALSEDVVSQRCFASKPQGEHHVHMLAIQQERSW